MRAVRCLRSVILGVMAGKGRPESEHGQRARYNAREDPCRCARCRAANAAYQARYRGREPRQQSERLPPGASFEDVPLWR